MARLLKTDGTEIEVIPRGKKWSLEELQGFVGGYIELMPGVRIRIVMDEEARLKNKPFNKKATEIVLEQLADKILRYTPELRGDILILDPKEKM